MGVEKNCRQIEQWPSDQIREQTGKRSTMDLINRTFTSGDGHTRGVGFPYNYHNSFWSNYFANYWHPSSYYHQQLQAVLQLHGHHQELPCRQHLNTFELRKYEI